MTWVAVRFPPFVSMGSFSVRAPASRGSRGTIRACVSCTYASVDGPAVRLFASRLGDSPTVARVYRSASYMGDDASLDIVRVASRAPVGGTGEEIAYALKKCEKNDLRQDTSQKRGCANSHKFWRGSERSEVRARPEARPIPTADLGASPSRSSHHTRTREEGHQQDTLLSRTMSPVVDDDDDDSPREVRRRRRNRGGGEGRS